MGGGAFLAYFYKNCYYRFYSTWSPPDGIGDWFAAKIPREEQARQAWIQSLGEKIEQEVAWRHEHGVKNNDIFRADYKRDGDGGFTMSYLGRELLFEFVQCNDAGMLSGDGYDIDWTYVIDLENRAFTINGLMHFRLDNMPPGSLNFYIWRVPSPRFPDDSCIPTFAHLPSTPIEYIAAVSRCPPPDFDIARAHEEYAQLAPAVLSANDWGAPTWASLTVAQQLSANLVQTILLDSAEKMANPDVVGMQQAFGICRWQLLSAAAPSHLCCPLELSTLKMGRYRYRDALSIEEYLRRDPSATYLNYLTPQYFKSCDWRTSGRNLTCYWFRGCLVAFRPRLDGVE